MIATSRGQCRKAGCSNERGVTDTGLDSLFCQYHIDLAAQRIAQFVHDHPAQVDLDGQYRETVRVQAAQAPAPAVQPFLAPEFDLCTRCGDAPRQAGDSLCEDCRGN